MLKGNPVAQREKPLFWKAMSPWPAPKNRPFHWVSYAIVDREWKLMSNRDASHFELYNIAADPFEKSDLKSQKSEVAKELLKKLEDWKATLPEKPGGNVFSAERKDIKAKPRKSR